MRDIKFRAWDTKQKKWYWMVNFTNEGISNKYNPFLEDETHDLIWCQYTGLKDKNEKMIFDGDILSDRISPPFVMKWNDEEALWGSREIGFGSAKNFYSKTEVIGNIYENPELLEGGK